MISLLRYTRNKELGILKRPTKIHLFKRLNPFPQNQNKIKAKILPTYFFLIPLQRIFAKTVFIGF